MQLFFFSMYTLMDPSCVSLICNYLSKCLILKGFFASFENALY